MTREEFVDRIGAAPAPTSEEYAIVEYVYTWHPIIDPVKGKDQIAAIYQLPHGMRIIKDMRATAEEAEKLDAQISVARRKAEEAQRELHELLQRLHRMAE